MNWDLPYLTEMYSAQAPDSASVRGGLTLESTMMGAASMGCSFLRLSGEKIGARWWISSL